MSPSGLVALESWAIRRTLLRAHNEGRQQVRGRHPEVRSTRWRPDRAGDCARRSILSEQTAETRVWPSDTRMADHIFPASPALRQPCVRTASAWSLGSDRAVPAPTRARSTRRCLLPVRARDRARPCRRGGVGTGTSRYLHLDSEAAGEGVTCAVNPTRQPHPGHEIAQRLPLEPAVDRRRERPTGWPTAGLRDRGKWTLLNEFSLLVLNKEILGSHLLTTWTQDDIAKRSMRLKGRSARCGLAHLPRFNRPLSRALRRLPAGELPQLPWTDSDVARLAAEAGETILIVLDTLATEPGRKWSNSDFVDAGLTKLGVRRTGGAHEQGARGLRAREHPGQLSPRGRHRVVVGFGGVRRTLAVSLGVRLKRLTGASRQLDVVVICRRANILRTEPTETARNRRTRLESKNSSICRTKVRPARDTRNRRGAPENRGVPGSSSGVSGETP